MNKLDKSMYDGIKNKYINQMVPIVKNKYKDFSSKHSTLFMNNSFNLKNIFESNGVINDKKIEKLLISQFEQMDENIINYMKTCIFTYLVINKVYQLHRDIKKYFNCQDSKQAIRNYLNDFNNSIIKSYLDPRTDYCTLSSLEKLCTNIKKDLIILNQSINEIINYNDLPSKLKNQILIASGIEICPYCGRQFVTRYKDKSSADIDHFFPKKFLPLLSLSLYNFIPSCQICNSRFKNQHIKKILYPFDDGYKNNAMFKVKYLSPFTDIRPEIEIQIENISKDKSFETDEDIKLFHIDEIYQSHNEFISDLIYRNHIYNNPAYKQSIKDLLLFDLDNEQMNILLFGYSLDLEKDEKKQLGKLVNDILNTL